MVQLHAAVLDLAAATVDALIDPARVLSQLISGGELISLRCGNSG
jgi:hypothetical protein